MYRQGDLLIQKCDAVPGGVSEVGRIGGRLILAEGEVTGHDHSVSEANAEMFSERDGVLYLRAPNGCDVVHQEHAAVTLSPGTYRIQRQQQWHAGRSQRVLD